MRKGVLYQYGIANVLPKDDVNKTWTSLRKFRILFHYVAEWEMDKVSSSRTQDLEDLVYAPFCDPSWVNGAAYIPLCTTDRHSEAKTEQICKDLCALYVKCKTTITTTSSVELCYHY